MAGLCGRHIFNFNFMVLDFTFVSVIHIELLFVCGELRVFYPAQGSSWSCTIS